MKLHHDPSLCEEVRDILEVKFGLRDARITPDMHKTRLEHFEAFVEELFEVNMSEINMMAMACPL